MFNVAVIVIAGGWLIYWACQSWLYSRRRRAWDREQLRRAAIARAEGL